MESNDDEDVAVSLKSRKRQRNEQKWAKQISKKRRYSSVGKQPNVACNHVTHGYCKANTLTEEDITRIFEAFYVDNDKIRQDQSIAMKLSITPVKRRRKRHADSTKNRQYSVTYEVVKVNGEAVEVCSKSFLSLLSVGKNRVRNVAAYKWQHDNVRPERRGGKRERPGYGELTEAIRQHIMSFRCRTSHHGGNKTSGRRRRYLPVGLNVKKMHLLFLQTYSGLVPCQYQFYRHVFVADFNLSFGTPKKDICCLHVKASAKATEDNCKNLVTYRTTSCAQEGR